MTTEISWINAVANGGVGVAVIVVVVLFLRFLADERELRKEQDNQSSMERIEERKLYLDSQTKLTESLNRNTQIVGEIIQKCNGGIHPQKEC